MEFIVLFLFFFASLFAAPKAGKAIGFLSSDHRSLEVSITLALHNKLVSPFWMKFSLAWFVLMILNAYFF